MADNKDILTCPACGKEMEKVFIESMQKHLDICLNGCGGMFFDNREFEKVDEQNENIDEILSLVSGRNFQPVNDKELRACPYCGANMVKTNIFLPMFLNILLPPDIICRIICQSASAR